MGTTDPTPNEFGSRVEFFSWLEELGFTPRTTVTGKTSVLFVGPEYGRVKFEKALKIGIPILPYTFPLALGYLSSRRGSPFFTKELNTLTLFTLTLADNLHGIYHLTGDERAGLASRAAGGVVQRLLLLQGGPVGERVVGGGEGVGWADTDSVREIVSEIDEGWKLVIGFLEVMEGG